MDTRVVAALEAAGIAPSFGDRRPIIPVEVDEERRPRAHGRRIVVFDGERTTDVELETPSVLFTGHRQPPDFGRGPTDEYFWFFWSIEAAAADYCTCTSERVRDREFERIYGELRRRPDRDSDEPLVSHLQATVRLYLSLFEVSEAEHDAVLRRLARSARTFAFGPTSTRYLDRALLPLTEGKC